MCEVVSSVLLCSLPLTQYTKKMTLMHKESLNGWEHVEKYKQFLEYHIYLLTWRSDDWYINNIHLRPYQQHFIFFVIYEWTPKPIVGCKGLPKTNNHILGIHKLWRKRKFCKYDSWNQIHNTSFSLSFMNGPKKL